MSSENKIKIVQIIADSSLSGAPATVFNFAKYVDKERFDFICVCPLGPLSDKLREIAGIRVIVDQMNSKWNLLAIGRLRSLLRKLAPDIVDCQGVRAGWLGRLAAVGLSPKPKVIYTEHLWTKEYHLKNPFTQRVQLSLLKFLDLFTDKTIAVSQAVADFLTDSKITTKDKVVVLYSGLPLPACKPVKKESGLTIGFVGSLVERKGLGTLLKALLKVIKELNNSGLKLVIVGDGPERNNLELMAKELNISKYVQFTGSSNQVDRLYSSFDLYVQPSLDEAFGFAVLEAMSHGLPVIASHLGGLVEILKGRRDFDGTTEMTECGILVRPADPDALAKATLLCLKDDELRQKLSKAAVNRASDFEIHKTIKKKEDFYSGFKLDFSQKPANKTIKRS